MSRHTVTNRVERPLVPERLYNVGGECYAWSPDGEGCYWYDTLAEAFEQHGKQTIYSVDDITDF